VTLNPIATTGDLTLVGATVVGSFVTIVARFEALVDMTITAAGRKAIVETGIPILVVAVITGFTGGKYNPITTLGFLTITATGVGGNEVSIVARFNAFIHQTIATASQFAR